MKYFSKVDRSGRLDLTIFLSNLDVKCRYYRGYLSRDDSEVLLMTLGYYVSDSDLDAVVQDILNGEKMSNGISFNQFSKWWSSDSGSKYLKRK